MWTLKEKLHVLQLIEEVNEKTEATVSYSCYASTLDGEKIINNKVSVTKYANGCEVVADDGSETVLQFRVYKSAVKYLMSMMEV